MKKKDVYDIRYYMHHLLNNKGKAQYQYGERDFIKLCCFLIE